MFERINAGVLKEKELLEEKLSKEISLNFSISEKLAKRFIYETHLSLDEFKNEIQKQQKTKELKEKLTKKNIEKLYSAIQRAKELIGELSQNDLEKLKKVLAKKEFIIGQETEVIKAIFSNSFIEKAKNPKNISEHIMGASLGIINSTINVGEVIYSVGMGLIKSPYDLISIMKGNARLENYKKI